jgi:hypothetical protein
LRKKSHDLSQDIPKSEVGYINRLTLREEEINLRGITDRDLPL